MNVIDVLNEAAAPGNAKTGKPSAGLPPLPTVGERIRDRIREAKSTVFLPLIAEAHRLRSENADDCAERLQRENDFHDGWAKSAKFYYALEFLSRCLLENMNCPDVSARSIQSWHYFHYPCKVGNKVGNITPAQWELSNQAGKEIFDPDPQRVGRRREEVAGYTPAQAVALAERFLRSVLEDFDDLFPAVDIHSDPQEAERIKNGHRHAMGEAVGFVRKCLGEIKREYAAQELAAALRAAAAKTGKNPERRSGFAGARTHKKNMG